MAAGLCRKCQIELAYAIGVAHPVSVLVDTYGTGVLDEEKLSAIVNDCFDMRPAKIIEHLDLRRPIYEQTAAYGHFGRTDVDLPWEHTDMVPSLCIICTPAAGSACGGRFLCNSRAAWRRAAASFHGTPCAHEVLYR
ncbi:S-adenosylmethionine synthase [Flavonifractor plautii]|uniref:S-adenosylmethionine synthase n=1 Tax=Flavonifractor plautii TaxID=292800 RepID=A0A174JQL2_FLAPL|nr:S-adenosylmethionine synthase [Flavonifractor plautii]